MSVNKKKKIHGIVAIVLIISDRNTTTLILFITLPPTIPWKCIPFPLKCIFEPVMLHFVIIILCIISSQKTQKTTCNDYYLFVFCCMYYLLWLYGCITAALLLHCCCIADALLLSQDVSFAHSSQIWIPNTFSQILITTVIIIIIIIIVYRLCTTISWLIFLNQNIISCNKKVFYLS